MKFKRRIYQALYVGVRGFPGGSSLVQLLAQKRGVRNIKSLPPLSVAAILKWAKVHYQRTGMWPNAESGSIPESPGDRWRSVDDALRNRGRGLTVRTSLAKLLDRHVRNGRAKKPR